MSIRDANLINYKLFLSKNINLYLLLWLAIYPLAIFQDYLYAQLRDTGFYWSETMLYNTYWLWFIPSGYLLLTLVRKIQLRSKGHKIFYLSSIGLLFTMLHLLLFVGVFILFSNLFFYEPHRFLTILRSAISNLLYLTVIAYSLMLLVFEYAKKKREIQRSSSVQKQLMILKVKQGSRIINIETATIQCISTNRPYTLIYTAAQNYLHDVSLKTLEDTLDTQIFLRVHRSTIINKHYVKELQSRKNGDYDAILKNGQSVRLSRHYRENWAVLINHLA